MNRRMVGVAIALMLAAVGCSGDVNFSFGGESADDAAVTLIEGQEVQDLLNIGPITNAQCEAPASNEIGTHFACTADSAKGQLQYDVEIDAEDHIFANPTNVISPDAQALFAAEAANALNDQVGSNLAEDSIYCGDEVVLFESLADMPVLACALTSPDTGDVYDADITITDLETGGITINVADAPRP